MSIGFFDSGVGGLTVLSKAMLALPEESFIYYADEEHVPYGERTDEEISRYVLEAMSFLADKGVSAVVIACNTATSVAVERVREEYSMPIIGVEPAVKPALREAGEGRILVAATPVTVRREKLHKLIHDLGADGITDVMALPRLVRLAEDCRFSEDEVKDYLFDEFQYFDPKIHSVIVLGCTHFFYFKDVIRHLVGETVKIIDGSGGTARYLAKKLKELGLEMKDGPHVEYYSSGRPASSEELAKIAVLQARIIDMEKVQ